MPSIRALTTDLPSLKLEAMPEPCLNSITCCDIHCNLPHWALVEACCTCSMCGGTMMSAKLGLACSPRVDILTGVVIALSDVRRAMTQNKLAKFPRSTLDDAVDPYSGSHRAHRCETSGLLCRLLWQLQSACAVQMCSVFRMAFPP